MNKSTEEVAIKCLGLKLTMICPRCHGEECAYCDGHGRVYTGEGLELIGKISNAIKSQSDKRAERLIDALVQIASEYKIKDNQGKDDWVIAKEAIEADEREYGQIAHEKKETQ